MSFERRAVLLTVAIAALAIISIYTLRISYNLADFLPSPSNDAQQLLVERLGQDTAARTVFVIAPNEEKAIELLSALQGTPGIADIRLAGDSAEGTVPPVVLDNLPLLADLPGDEPSWRAELAERSLDVATASDADLTRLIGADPALATEALLERLNFTPGDAEFARRVLILQSAAAAFDMGGQGAFVQDLRARIEPVSNNAELLGAGVYGADLQRQVQREAILFSVLASIALAALVYWRFRSLSRLFGVMLPLAFGGVAGMTVLALTMGEVHGITLAFGFTLLGIAIDYPLHLFSHRDPTTGLWQTMRLGAASTCIAYAVFVFADAGALVQLGVFATAGIGGAIAAAAWLDTQHKRLPDGSAQPVSPRLRHVFWAIAALSGTLAFLFAPPANDDLGELTPVPAEVIQRDSEIRQQLSAEDLRYVVALRHEHLEQTLRATEKAAAILSTTPEVPGFRAVTTLLPSRQTQERRRTAIDPAGFEAAALESNFRPGFFAAFSETLARHAQHQSWLTPADFEDTPLAGVVTNQLYHNGTEWVSLITLSGLTDPQSLRAAGLSLVDLKQASMTLVEAYRSHLSWICGFALALILGVLLIATRDPRRVIWVIGCLLGSVAVAAAISAYYFSGLSLFDLMALVLVAGLVLDYALFYSKPAAHAAAVIDAHRSVSLCAASSAIVFGMLALSDIPVLQHLGVTVLAGVATGYALARFSR